MFRSMILLRTQSAPSPLWGEGWGERVTELSIDLNPSPHPSPSRSRIYPTSANFKVPNSGKPEFGGRGSRPNPPRGRRSIVLHHFD